MLTVSQMGLRYGVSRATLLYYERNLLLQACSRNEAGYRYYGAKAQQRLESILAYRSYGVSVAQIRQLLDQSGQEEQEQILQSQFENLELEIRKLRQQQQGIMALLQRPPSQDTRQVSKERWVEIMRAAGFSEEDMRSWHQQFERMEPQEHHRFLQSLGIDETEIAGIRKL